MFPRIKKNNVLRMMFLAFLTASSVCAMKRVRRSLMGRRDIPDEMSQFLENSECYVAVGEKTLGSGSFGDVCEVQCIKTTGESEAIQEKFYAVKRIRNVFVEDGGIKALRELRILRELRDDQYRIVRVVDIIVPQNLTDYNDLYVVFERIDKDMSTILKSSQYLKEKQVKCFLYQILCGVKYMHSSNVVHCDLKPCNILVNDNGSLRVADFGLSRYATERERSSDPSEPSRLRRINENARGNEYYRAPEVILRGQRPNTQFAIDIWAAGCIFGELLQLRREGPRGKIKELFARKGIMRHPICAIFNVVGTPEEDVLDYMINEKNKNVIEQIKEIEEAKKVDWLTKFPDIGEHGRELLNGMLEFDPRKRWTVDQCLSHHYFSDVRNSRQERCSDNKLTFEFPALDGAETKCQLRGLINDEISFFHPEIQGKYDNSRLQVNKGDRIRCTSDESWIAKGEVGEVINGFPNEDGEVTVRWDSYRNLGDEPTELSDITLVLNAGDRVRCIRDGWHGDRGQLGKVIVNDHAREGHVQVRWDSRPGVWFYVRPSALAVAKVLYL